MAKVTRTQVLKAVDVEREYQVNKWGVEEATQLGTFISYLESYIYKAKSSILGHSSNEAPTEALDNIRKVAALAVACLEQHGCPTRSTGK